MKKTNLIITLVVATAVMLITSCKGGKDATEKDIVTKADTLTMESTSKGIFSQPVCAELALRCINRYRKMYDTTFNEAFVRAAYSRSATFDKDSLVNWMKDIDTTTSANKIKIFFGVYTKEMIAASKGQIDPKKENHLTVFLWPYIDDEIATFNKPSIYNIKGCPVVTDKENKLGGGPVAPYNIAGLEP